jgi:Na+/melibiose symporter-like transporter
MTKTKKLKLYLLFTLITTFIIISIINVPDLIKKFDQTDFISYGVCSILLIGCLILVTRIKDKDDK